MAGAPTSVRGSSLAAPRAPSTLGLTLALLAAATPVGWLIVSQPELYRPMFAFAIASVLGLAALRWPNPAILATFLFLPVLGLIRRLFIESSGWPEADPLLLVGPVLALILFIKAYVLESRALLSDLLSKLVLIFLALVVVGVVNPMGAGIEEGGAALILTGFPLLWFFIGRALPDHRTIARLMYATAFLAAAIAIYGICQTEIGFPSWDLAWIEVGGYVSLNVGETVRGFGSLPSATEYAFYLGAGFVIAIAALFDRRTWPLVLLPILATGILLSSVRFVMVLGTLALLVMLGLRSKRPRLALPVIATVALAAYLLAAPVISGLSSQSGSDLVSHQLEGIARPFDEDTSTAPGRLTQITRGISDGVKHPVGQGVAPGSLASDELGYTAGGTELDFSNTFVSFGLPGGLLFLAIACLAFAAIGRNYVRTRDPFILGALGLAVVTLGFWLNGGHYALTPLLWLILGWATRPMEGRDPSRAARAG